MGMNRHAHSRNESDSEGRLITSARGLPVGHLVLFNSSPRYGEGRPLEAFRNQLSLGWLFPTSHDNFASAHSFDDIELAQHAYRGVDLG